MKPSLILVGLAAMMTTPANADDVKGPAAAVALAIAAATRDELKDFVHYVDLPAVASDARHPRSPEEVVALLKKIGSDKSTLRPMHTENENIGLVMIHGAADYEIELRREATKEQARFIVSAIR